MRVMIVEDDEMLATTLAWFAEEHGDEAIVCDSGNRALDAAAEWTPDLVLVDLGLPDMSGSDLCRSMRANPHMAHAKIIAHTAHSDTDHRNEAKDAGFDDYYVKGIDFESLTGLLKRLH